MDILCHGTRDSVAELLVFHTNSEGGWMAEHSEQVISSTHVLIYKLWCEELCLHRNLHLEWRIESIMAGPSKYVSCLWLPQKACVGSLLNSCFWIASICYLHAHVLCDTSTPKVHYPFLVEQHYHKVARGMWVRRRGGPVTFTHSSTLSTAYHIHKSANKLGHPITPWKADANLEASPTADFFSREKLFISNVGRKGCTGQSMEKRKMDKYTQNCPVHPLLPTLEFLSAKKICCWGGLKINISFSRRNWECPGSNRGL